MDYEKYGEVFRKGNVTLINCDCMDLMADAPENHWQLSIIDPPYGIGAGTMTMGKGKNKNWGAKKDWDSLTPAADFFTELFRVSEKQIIWGGNYFLLPLTGGWIYWNKDRNKDVSFADGELAWTSFLSVIKEAKIKYDGFLGADIQRIHPTQKPVKLYDWLLSNYAEPGDKILDTHLGSGSSAIAAHYAGHDFVGIELDENYFKAAKKRFDESTKQEALF